MNSMPDVKENPCDLSDEFRIGDLKTDVQLIDRHTKVSKVKALFQEDEPIKGIVVAEKKKAIGLVMNIHLDRILSQKFGFSLYYERAINRIMDVSPLIVDAATPLQTVADMVIDRDNTKILDHVIVTENDTVAGVVSVHDIVNTMSKLQKRHADSVNLMNEQLQREIRERIKAETELVTLNRELEERVHKRTADIEKSNRKLQSAVSVAEAANKAKSDFLSNMSHELRTPLNHIIGFTELVLEQHFGPLNKAQSDYLTHVLNSSNHLLSLINDILDLSKIEAGKYELIVSVVDLAELLRNSIIMVKEKAQKHNIKIVTRFENLPKTIEGDARKIKQILYNLLSNAVKFTGDNGHIHLSARRMTTDSELPIETSNPIAPAADVELVEISVKDSGIGLKAEDLEVIFNPFEQVDSARNRKYQGTGLGLSLTKKFVELHSGFIWAQSEGEGLGADFRFVLPSRQSTREENDRERACPAAAFNG